MKRRNFIMSAIAGSLAGLTAVVSSVYRVRFKVDLKEISESEFFAQQGRFENNDRIDDLNREYVAGGRLVTWGFSRNANRLQWTYYFKSQADFASWENDLYRLGLVQKDGRPYQIQRDAREVSGLLAAYRS